MTAMPDVLRRVEAAEHVVFTRGQYNLNIIGVRAAPGEPDRFDDRLHVVYKDHRNAWVDLCFAATTDPGMYYLQNPMNVKGTAIL